MQIEQFEQKWIENFAALSKYVYCHIYNKNDVEDILQQTAIKAITNRDSLLVLTKFKSWIFRIAMNTIIDYYRKKKIEPNFVEIIDALNTSDGNNNYSLCEWEIDLKQYGNSLPLKKRSLLLLLMQQHMTLKEIASVLNIGYSTARKWREEIKQEIKKIGRAVLHKE